MRLHLFVPKVDPEGWEEPTNCPYPECGGKGVRLHQPVKKPVPEMPTDFPSVSTRY